MMCTTIGRKVYINIIIILIFNLGLSSCIFQERPSDYRFEAFFKNSTSDTLNLILGNDSLYYGVREFVLYPSESIPIGGCEVDKGESVVKKCLPNGRSALSDQARIYKDDSLMVNWLGPHREMADSIHHFFNYNSWDYWLIDNDNGVVRFTIDE